MVFLVFAAICAATRFSAAATSRGAVPRVTIGEYVTDVFTLTVLRDADVTDVLIPTDLA